MFTCSNKQCNAHFSDQRADELKGTCDKVLAGGVKCLSPLMNESRLGWHYVDSLRDKPLDPTSAQSIAAAKGKHVPAAKPVSVTLTPAQTKLALKRHLSMSQIAAFTPQERADFDSAALKEV